MPPTRRPHDDDAELYGLVSRFAERPMNLALNSLTAREYVQVLRRAADRKSGQHRCPVLPPEPESRRTA